MLKYLPLLLCLFSFLAHAQTDSSKYHKVGIKINPPQFLFGEVALTTELKLTSPYSIELKLGRLFRPHYAFSLFDARIASASGFISQFGSKRYFDVEPSVKFLEGRYLQVLLFYKNTSFDSYTYVENGRSDSYYDIESQFVNTYGLKLQVGFERRFKVLYYEIYVGLGYRIRDVNKLILEEGIGNIPWNHIAYPVKKREVQSYFTPQAGFNIGFHFNTKK